MTVVDLLRTHVEELPRAYADHMPGGLPLPTRCPGMAHVLEWAIPGVIAICKEAEHLGCVWKVVLRRGAVHASLVAEWSLTARALAEELIARTRAGDLMVTSANHEVARLHAELLVASEIAAVAESAAPAIAGELIAPIHPGDLTVMAPDDEAGGPGAEPVDASGIAAVAESAAPAIAGELIAPIHPGDLTVMAPDDEAGGPGAEPVDASGIAAVAEPAAPAKRPRPALGRTGLPRPSSWGTYFTTTRVLGGHPEDQPGRREELNALAVMLDPRDGTLAGAINVSQWLITQVMDKGRPVSTDIASRVHALLRASG